MQIVTDLPVLSASVEPFTGDTLAPAVIGAHIIGTTPVRVMGDILYAYNGAGLWLPCEEDLRRSIARALGNRWRTTHAKETLAWARDWFPPLAEPKATAYTLNFENGMLDLLAPAEDALTRHTEDPCSDEHGDWTIQLPYGWDDNGQMWTTWEHEGALAMSRFLDQTFPDPEMLQFVLEVIGYMLLRGNPLQSVFLLYGRGATGKSTLMHVLGALVGQQNVSAVPLRHLLTNQFAGSLLIDKMLNLAGEVSADTMANPEVLKRLTGGDPILAERKGRDGFLYTPFAKHVFAANDFPMSEDVSDAMLRRFVIVPFDHVVPEDQREREDHLRSRLTVRHELEYLVYRAVGALQRLIRRGYFDPPQRVVEAKADFAEGMSDARGWLRERAMVVGGASIKAGDAWRDYERFYAARGGRSGLGRNTFYAQLREVPGVSYRANPSTGQREFLGLALRPTDS